ncbi:MAG: YjbQ family protein [Candidatus Caldatribacterium sp.]|nr:YjbQ family protein [Candidatus Caldatribacterium sp.]
MLKTLLIETRAKEDVIDITDLVAQVVQEAKAEEAGVFVYVPHGDAAVNIQAGKPSSFEPPLNDLLKKVLEKDDFERPETGAAFVAPTEVLIAHQGKLLLGEDQRIYFYEFNGPKKRSVHVLVIPSSASWGN